MIENQNISIKLIFSIVGWFIGVLMILEERLWSTLLIHSSTASYFFFLFLFIRQNSNYGSPEQVTFWKKSNPSFNTLFSGKTIHSQLLLILTPIVIWSNWWPHYKALSTHKWEEIEQTALGQLEKSEQISNPKLSNFRTQWNDSTTVKEYSLTSASDTGTLILIVNKQDSLIKLTYKQRGKTTNN